MDPLNTQVEEGEEDSDGLLLVPGDGVRNGEGVDIGLEDGGQSGRHLDGTEGVIALPHVQKTRDPTDVSHLLPHVVEAVLPARQGDHHGVGGCVRNEVVEVGTLLTGAVTSADHKEVLQFPRLDGLQDLPRLREDGIVAESGQEGAGLTLLAALLLSEAVQGEGMGDDLGEVAVFDAFDVCEPDAVGGVDAVSVGLAGFHEAVGGEDDRPGEEGELRPLELPRTAIVSRKVRELLQLRVRVRREQLPVRVHVDPLPFRLLQKLVGVTNVVSADEDSLSRNWVTQNLDG